MQAAIAHLEHGRDEGAIGSVLVSIFIQGIEEAKALLGTTSDPTLRLFFLTTAGSLLECLTEAQQRAWAASACAATRAPRIAIRTGGCMPETAPRPVLDRLLQGFPFPTPRPMQIKAVGVMAVSLESGARFTVVEGPTGSGKSALAIALAETAAARGADSEYKPGAYILTSQKSLALQLLGDFSPLGLVELKGRSNYPCTAHETTCDEGSILNRRQAAAAERDKDLEDEGEPAQRAPRCPSCPYAAAKNAFIRSPLAVTNYANFITEAALVRQLEPRQALILDEAHNIEREVIAMVDIKVTEARCEELSIARPPRFEPRQESQTLDWLNRTLMPAVEVRLARYETEARRLNMSKEEGNGKKAMRVLKKAEAADLNSTMMRAAMCRRTLKSAALIRRPCHADGITKQQLTE